MLKFENSEENLNDNFSLLTNPVALVTRKNFHSYYNDFKDKIMKSECKYVFLNVDFTNSQIFSEKLELNINEFEFIYSYYKKILSKVNKNSPHQDECQILNTEILLVHENKEKGKYTLYPYLIPTLKFQKFTGKETLINLDPEILTYFNFMSSFYKFNNISNLDSLSYLNLNEKENILNKLELILKEGKPTKNENTKSYYYYPKNIVIPDKSTKEKLEVLMSYILDSLKRISEESPTCPDYEVIQIENYFITEKLLNFEWRNLLNPYDKNLINLSIKSLEVIKFQNCLQEYPHDLKDYFLKFLDNLTNYFQLLKEDPSKIENPLLIEKTQDNYFKNFDKFIYSWINFLEIFYDNKISVSLRIIAGDYFIFIKIFPNSYFDILTVTLQGILIKFSNIFKSEEKTEFISDEIFDKKGLSSFNLLELIPLNLHQDLSTKYIINIKYSQELLMKVDFSKTFPKKYENLFMNLNNEKEILFDYELEKELYVFLALFKREVDNKLLESSKDYININNHDFLQDIYLFLINKKTSEKFKNIFKGFLNKIKVDTKKKEFQFKFKKNISEEELKNNFLLNKEKETEIRYELINFFIEEKKKLLIKEEFGVSKFINFIFEKSDKLIVGSNLLPKFLNIFNQIFSNSRDLDSCSNFLNFLKKIKFLDLNYYTSKHNLNFVKEFSKMKINSNHNLITYKYFNIFNNLQIDSEINQEFINKFYIENIMFMNLDESSLHQMKSFTLTREGKIVSEEIQYTKSRMKLTLTADEFESELVNLILNCARKYGDLMVNLYIYF